MSCKLQELGYTQSLADYCLYVKNNTRSFTALLVYVDDLLITGNNEKEMKKIKKDLYKLFTVKDLGQAEYFLGLKIVRKKMRECI